MAEAAQAHGQVGAEGGAAHLQVVDRVGDAVLDLVGQLPQPALGHHVHRRAAKVRRASGAIAAVVRRHRSTRPRSMRVDRDGDVARRRRACRPTGASVVSRAAARSRRWPKTQRVVVVAVGAPGQPLRAEVEFLGGGVGMDAGRAQRQVVGDELVLVPDALLPSMPGARASSRSSRSRARVQMRAERDLERHVEVGQQGGADLAGTARGCRRAAARAPAAASSAATSAAEVPRPVEAGRRGGGSSGRSLRSCSGWSACATRGRRTASPGGPWRTRRRAASSGGVEALLGGQRGHLGEGGVLELVEPRGQDVVDGLGGLLGGAAEEASPGPARRC